MDSRQDLDSLLTAMPHMTGFVFNEIVKNDSSIDQAQHHFVFDPQVFSHAPPIEMTERFHDVLQFSSHVAKLMVSEIKKRATNLSTG